MWNVFWYSDNKQQLGSIGGPAKSDPEGRPTTNIQLGSQSVKQADRQFTNLLHFNPQYLMWFIWGWHSLPFFLGNTLPVIFDLTILWMESSGGRPGLFIFIMNLTFHLNSNQNFKPFKMTDDRSLESISKFKISTSVTTLLGDNSFYIQSVHLRKFKCSN